VREFQPLEGKQKLCDWLLQRIFGVYEFIYVSKFARHSLPVQLLVSKVIRLRHSSAPAAVPPPALSSLLLPALDE
jgi:hypothetical protein